jgi:hypothetical protein
VDERKGAESSIRSISATQQHPKLPLRQLMSNILLVKARDVSKWQVQPGYVRAIPALCLASMTMANHWTPFAWHSWIGAPPTYNTCRRLSLANDRIPQLAWQGRSCLPTGHAPAHDIPPCIAPCLPLLWQTARVMVDWASSF